MMKKTLRFWILLLNIFIIIGILCSALFSAYLVTKQNVINQSLEINRVYSEKLAQITDEVFSSMKQDLESKQDNIAIDLDNAGLIDNKLERLLNGSHNFNSLTVVNNEGIIISTAPDLSIAGKELTSIGAKESLEQKRTLISVPFTSITNRLIITVSTPLWGEDNEYLGFLAGTIYLQEENILWTILGEHFAKNGSYVYVVDNSGTLIYHPDISRIGEIVKNNEIIEKLIKGQSGSQFITNSKGKDFLAGYTTVALSQWGVVSQTPYNVAIAPVINIIKKMFLYSIPFVALFIIITIYLTKRLASPLRKLALCAANYNGNSKIKEMFVIPSWYFEAEQLTKTIKDFANKQDNSINNYKNKSLTDSLTGLANRRYVEDILEIWKNDKDFFSLIIIDIDYFKKVNDQFGHQTGDEVLLFLSNKMKEFVRKVDVVARFGGEEFVILLVDTKDTEALSMAERIRENISNTISPTGENITISLGIGTYHKGEEIRSLFKRVDEALYQAKREGRNKSVLSQP